MVPSRILAAPGLRTHVRPPWRSEVGTALAVVAGQPHLWLLGTIGFALRGGFLLFMVPIIALPTQVEVRLALGTYLGSTGLTPEFWGVLVIFSGLLGAVCVGALLALARIEMSMFVRLVADPESADIRDWRPARQLPVGAHRVLFSRVFAIQALGLTLLCLFALPLAATVGQATLEELLRPSSSASIYVRVLGHLAGPVLIMGLGVIVVEAVTAIATRRLLLGATGFSATNATLRRPLLLAIAHALARPVRAPIRTLRTAALGWLVTALIVLPALWALGVAWQATRSSFLATTSIGEVGRDAGLLVIACLLAAVFLGGLLLAGFASAVRAGLWSVDALADVSAADGPVV